MKFPRRTAAARLSTGTSRPDTYRISTAVFLRLLGVVYLVAFVSLWVQMDGLIGADGLLPAGEYLHAVEQQLAREAPSLPAPWAVPTLAWLYPHDAALHALCAAGATGALLAVLGVLPLPALMVAWVAYLSLFHVGQDFLRFQWDILLLETGFLAICLAPAVVRSRAVSDPQPPRLAIWLLWWLLFRLMFESGLVKLTWNDVRLGPPAVNAWESLQALEFHFWTQPLPVWTSWFAAHLPVWLLRCGVVLVLVIELVLPWFIPGRRWMRITAWVGFTGLMLLIAATGNYNFFNLLTAAVALMLLDDACWPDFLRRRLPANEGATLLGRPVWRRWLLAPLSVLAVVVGVQQVVNAFTPQPRTYPTLDVQFGVGQFRLVNTYGLFRRITETRPEIVIEGSVDGRQWHAYEFAWKPGDPERRPRWVAPHQPRLDWQMWFEALRLERCQQVGAQVEHSVLSPWFQALLLQVLAGRGERFGLRAAEPLANRRPRSLRLVLYQYRFTTPSAADGAGRWWVRTRCAVWRSPAWERDAPMLMD